MSPRRVELGNRVMNKRLYVGNLPYEVSETELQELFASAGTVDHTYARLREQSDAMGEMPDSIHEAAADGDAASPYFWVPIRWNGAVVQPEVVS